MVNFPDTHRHACNSLMDSSTMQTIFLANAVVFIYGTSTVKHLEKTDSHTATCLHTFASFREQPYYEQP